MTHQFAISPDVHARDLTNWFLLNTRIQRVTGEPFRAIMYDDFGELQAAYDEGRVDLVFANAADTARLVRKHGFLPVATPAEAPDEAVVVVPDDGPLRTLGDLPASLSIAATDAPDVERICRILLEPADLGPGDLRLTLRRNYVLVAKAVLTGEVQAGFFLRAAYDALSGLTRARLHPLISSRIYVVRHCLLAASSIAGLAGPIRALLEGLTDPVGDQDLLAGLGAPNGWQPMSADEVEFMIDLMDALQQQ